MENRVDTEWAVRTVANEDYLPWADVQKAKQILGIPIDGLTEREKADYARVKERAQPSAYNGAAEHTRYESPLGGKVILFHASARENRDGIRIQGLLTAKDQTGFGAIYLSDKQPDSGCDVWQVDCTGFALEQDWTTEQDAAEYGCWWMFFQDIPRTRLALLSTTS